MVGIYETLFYESDQEGGNPIPVGGAAIGGGGRRSNLQVLVKVIKNRYFFEGISLQLK